MPHGLVYLADGCGGSRHVVELREAIAPVGAEFLFENAVDLLGRQRGSGILKLGERRSVRASDILGQCGLEDAHRLAELHRPALELAQHAEHLLRGTSL